MFMSFRKIQNLLHNNSNNRHELKKIYVLSLHLMQIVLSMNEGVLSGGAMYDSTIKSSLIRK